MNHPIPESVSPTEQAPIHILGILPRSGTNFLSDLLCLHPDCAAPSPIYEDYFLAYADRLQDYVSRTARHWSSNSSETPRLKRDMLAHLGAGLTSFLRARANAPRVVTKTPRVDRLHLFPDLFPNDYLLILVRDGRAVVESGIKSFRWNRESAIHHWAHAARTILRFAEQNNARKDRFLVVRFEDIVQDSDAAVRRILAFLRLDPARYDFSAMTALPVRGSSAVRDKASSLHWEPVRRTKDFNPLDRWAHWGTARHERFNWIAGKYLPSLGYEPQKRASFSILWTLWNSILDLKWLALKPLVFLGRRLRLRPGPDPANHAPDSSSTPATAPSPGEHVS
jgi:hypothetical protein